MSGRRITKVIALYAMLAAVTVIVVPRIARLVSDALIEGKDRQGDDVA